MSFVHNGIAGSKAPLSAPVKKPLDIGSKSLLVVLYPQHVVGPRLLDCIRDGGLTAHYVDRDDTALQHERFEKLRNGLDLVRTAFGPPLAQSQPLLSSPRLHQVQRIFLGGSVPTST